MRVPRRLPEPRLHVCWSNSPSAGFPLAPICCLLASLVLLASGPGGSTAEHFVVFWNSSNARLLRSDYTLTVHINDYLDIYCPYYSNEAFSSDSGDSFLSLANRERYVLHMVNHTEFLACDAHKGFVRWNCDRPGAPGSGLKFSEKFHFVTPFSAGFEFRPGREYYYMCK
uniref:Ephrin-A2b n=1 Tax=Eptatretus burgeri TaxID=7764 RepID=A0A8C4QLE4_EPTBU